MLRRGSIAFVASLSLLALAVPSALAGPLRVEKELQPKIPPKGITGEQALEPETSSFAVPPPKQLRSTEDAVVCAEHVKVPIFAAAICDGWIESEALLLLWSWEPGSSSIAANGFKLYEVPAPPPKLVLMAETAKQAAAQAAEQMRRATLVAVRDNPDQTIVDVPKPPGGYEGHCYVVTATGAGAKESDPSAPFCVRPEQPCTESADIGKRKRDYQLAALSNDTYMGGGENVHTVTARLETRDLPWKLPLEGPKSIEISAAIRPRLDDPAWTGVRRKAWFRDRIPLNDPARGCVIRSQPGFCATNCRTDPVVALSNDADFEANGRIRLLYLHGTNPEIPGEIRDQVERSLLAFRYWVTDEPGGGRQVGEMNLWSENHQILFAAAEYLAGQYFVNRDRDRQLRRRIQLTSSGRISKPVGRHVEVEKAGRVRGKKDKALAVDKSARITDLAEEPAADESEVGSAACESELCSKRVRGITHFCDGLGGQEHMDRSRSRIERWLDERFRFGFSEWNAPGYYNEDILALMNLADFVEDRELRKRAAAVLDLLFFDLARLNQKGSFGVAAGRAHGKHKLTGWKQTVGDVIEIAFGTRSRAGNCPASQGKQGRGTCWYEQGTSSAHAFASARRYCIPKVLAAIGREQPESYVERNRVSLGLDEGPGEGIGFSTLADAASWWSRAAFTAKQTIKLTCDTAHRLDLWKSNPFSGELEQFGLCGGGTGSGLSKLPSRIREPVREFLAENKEKVVDELSPVTQGMALTRANLQVYRNADVMLSSVQSWRRGQTGHQTNPWQATFDANATVFTSFPASKDFNEDGVNYWNGNAVNPVVVQHENAAIVAYNMPAIGILRLMYGPRTHAWFPRYAFDETFERPSQGCDCRVEAEKFVDATIGPASYKAWAKGCKRGSKVGLILFGPAAIPSSCIVHGSFQVGGEVLATAVSSSKGCACTKGKWFFGRRGNGYIGLFAAQDNCRWRKEAGIWEDQARTLVAPSSESENEIICDGHKRNVFIAQVGNQAEFGSFGSFVEKVVRARIHLNALNWDPGELGCSYDVPAGDLPAGKGHRLELHYDQRGKEGRYAGGILDFDGIYDHRFDNPYAISPWGSRGIGIRHRGNELSLTRGKKWGRYGHGITK